jgi:hypothetical protein
MNELTDDNMWCAAHDFVTPDADGQCPECARYEDDEDPDLYRDLLIDDEIL